MREPPLRLFFLLPLQLWLRCKHGDFLVLIYEPLALDLAGLGTTWFILEPKLALVFNKEFTLTAREKSRK